MGNIVGEKFEPFVFNQIDKRQKLYGSSYLEGSGGRNPAQLQLMNNKNAWLKMASSTSVVSDETPSVKNTKTGEYVDANISSGEKRLKDIGIDNTAAFTGNQLAQKTVLFNTLSSVNPTTYQKDKGDKVDTQGTYNFRSGVSNSNSLWNQNNSYGLGGTDQGLVPPPGLISFTLDSQNRGSIRKGTIELKCYNKFQFELIELVYLRLGYTMMIEWGWDKYTTNGTDLKTMGNTIIEDKWFSNSNENITQLKMIKTITKYQKLYSGNYDGFYGKVVNFSWGFNSDGSYDISIDLYSIGDVIESIKVDTSSTVLSLGDVGLIISGSNFPEGLGESPIVTNASSTSLSQDMFTDILGRNWDVANSHYLNPSIFFNKNKEKADSSASSDQYNYYMTFEALITKLQTYCIPKIVNDFGESSDMIHFDVNEDENVCAIYPNQISLDPKICLIKPPISFNTQPNESTTWVNFDPGWEFFREFAVSQNSTGKSTSIIYGKIMNIYLNYDFISKELLKSTESFEGLNGRLTVFKFLQSICSGINGALGGVNNLEVVLKDDNVITILEQNPIPGAEGINFLKGRMGNDPSFNLFGINPDGSSNFVKDFNFDTKITPELSSMITIGATANGVTKNYDGTAFSKWNEGLYDRFNKEFIDPTTLGILKQREQLYKTANAFGIVGSVEFSTEEAVQLFTAFSSSESNAGFEQHVTDYFTFQADNYATTAETLQLDHAADFVAEGSVDIYNTFANWFRSDENQISTFGTDNIKNIGDADISEYFDKFYSWNKETSALGATLKGYKTVPPNSSCDKEIEEVTWAEYVAEATSWRRSERERKASGDYTPEELMLKYNKNYAFYLTRVLGGDFAAGVSDGEVGKTELDEYSYFQFNPNIIREGKSAFKSYIDTLNNAIYSKTKNPSNIIGFIPVSLSLTFEGLSGIKIYNQISVVQGFLPAQYPKAFKFVISTVNHKIADNSWSTSLDTISTPKTRPIGAYSFLDLASAAATYTSGGGKGILEFLGATPNADKVRDYISTTGGFVFEKVSGATGGIGSTVGIDADGKTKGELSSGGDITSKAATMIITVLTSIRKLEPNIYITLTAGNDLYHHNIIKVITSRHEIGNAIDFTVRNPSTEILDKIKKILNSFIVGPKNWYYLDEYGSPTKASNGSHFHLSLPRPERTKGTGINTEMQNAKRQLTNNEIKPLP